MRIGHPIVDADHMQLIEIINLASNAISKKDLGSADNLMFSLLNYVSGHFEREEMILADIGYADLADHHAKHVAFGAYVTKMESALKSAASDTEKLALIDGLNSVLTNWLVQHILAEDTKMIPYLGGAGYPQEWSAP
jgi:hemerythrin